MSALTLDALKALVSQPEPSLTIDAVPVYELGAGKVAWIAELTADERDSRLEAPWEAYRERTGNDTGEHFKAFAVAACWCNTQARDFVAKDAAGIEAAAELLGKCSGKAVTRLFRAADKLNGLSPEALEAIEKNSPPAEPGNGT